MPIPTETFRSIRKLNIVFALTAVAGAASTAWMLLADFDRPWRNFQTDYFNNLAAIAHFDWLATQSPQARAERDRLKNALASAERDLDRQADRRRELADDQRRLAGELQAANMAYGNAKAQIQVTEFNYEEAKAMRGPDSFETRERFEALERERHALAEFQAAKEKLEDADRELKRQIKRFYAERDDARKKLAAFDKVVADAQLRDDFYGQRGTAVGGLVPMRRLFNVPGLDFAAPKNTPGRQEIRQVVLSDVRAELNFAQSYITDRCVTCHIGIDNPALSRAAFFQKLETALAGINARRADAGQPPLTVPGATSAPAKSAAPFAELPFAEQEQRIAALSGVVNDYLVSTGRAAVRLEQPLLAHPDLDLFVSPDSPHPMSRMGCTVCHEGNPQETDFVLASHSPRDAKQEHEWEHKYYVRQAGIPENTLHIAHEYWDRPMLLSRYTSASCAKCHANVGDLYNQRGEPLPSARPLAEGRELFTTLGCINCHAVEGLNDSRRVGPDLTHVASKLSPEFIHRWIEYPKDFRASTRMPHPFRQENNLPASRSDEDPDPLLRTQTEIAAITHYLLTFSKSYEPVALPADLKGDPKRGGELFTAIGCLACHANLAAVDPNDGDGRTFGEQWIVAELKHQGLSGDDAKKRYAAMSLNDRVQFATQNFPDHRRDELQAVADAERRAAEAAGRDPDPQKLYVPPRLTRFAPELSALGTKLVPDPADQAQLARARAWLYDWLREPRHYSSYTKMPRMFRDGYYWQEKDPAAQRTRNDQDIVDVAEYLLSLRHDTFKPQRIPDDAAHLAEATRLVTILLSGQNTQSAVETILADRKFDAADKRGALSDRIVRAVAPSFGAQGEAAASAIVEKQSVDGRLMLFLGSKMINHYGCYACHQIAGFETASRPGTELSGWGRKLLSQLDFSLYYDGFDADRAAQPDLFNFLFPKSAEFDRLVADTGDNPEIHITHTHQGFAYHKLRNPRLWDRGRLKRPYDKLKMPNFFLSHREAEALVTFLLSRQPPLVAPAARVAYTDTPTGRVARGRQLAQELNCIGCHSIENNSANVHQYFIKPDPASGEMTFDVTNAPPNLFGEGAKIQFTWLYGFLNNVEMLRPWLKIRMPSFHLDAVQTTALVEYFVGAAQLQADALGQRLAKVHGFIDAARETAPTRAEADAVPPGADWWAEPTLAKAADWLARFCLRNKLLTDYDLEPAAGVAPDEALQTRRSGFAKALDKAEFLGPAYTVSYPFAAAPRPAQPDTRYETGKSLLLELKCLACHVAGDPFAPGTTADIKAPNFALAQRRLRYDWIVKWLLNPQLFQPGTNMPQLFGGGNSAFKDFPEAERGPAETKYGKSGMDQIPLLVDFLYELGRRNSTVTQPPDANAAATSQPTPALKPGAMKSEFDDEPAAKPADGGAKPASPPKGGSAKPAGDSEPKKGDKTKSDDDFQP